jgi:ElaB/YqjD/DUF883 family membrane-anchored ribosome-binding protein
MSKQTESTDSHTGVIVAGGKISQARKRITTALDRGREFAGDVRDKAAEGVKVVDQRVRENPYYAIAICIGLGVPIGYFIARRFSRKSG